MVNRNHPRVQTQSAMDGTTPNLTLSDLCVPDGSDPDTLCVYPDYGMLGRARAAEYPWNNPDMVISMSTLYAIETAVTCGLGPLLLLVGVPGNLLICAVYRRLGLGDRMHVCLFSLGLVDLCCVLVYFLLCSPCLLGAACCHDYFMGRYKWNILKYARGKVGGWVGGWVYALGVSAGLLSAGGRLLPRLLCGLVQVDRAKTHSRWV